MLSLSEYNVFSDTKKGGFSTVDGYFISLTSILNYYAETYHYGQR